MVDRGLIRSVASIWINLDNNWGSPPWHRKNSLFFGIFGRIFCPENNIIVSCDVWSQCYIYAFNSSFTACKILRVYQSKIVICDLLSFYSGHLENKRSQLHCTFVWSVKEHPNGEKEDEKFKLLKCYLEMHNSSGALGAIVLCTLVPAYISPPPQW